MLVSLSIIGICPHLCLIYSSPIHASTLTTHGSVPLSNLFIITPFCLDDCLLCFFNTNVTSPVVTDYSWSPHSSHPTPDSEHLKCSTLLCSPSPPYSMWHHNRYSMKESLSKFLMYHFTSVESFTIKKLPFLAFSPTAEIKSDLQELTFQGKP